MTLSEYNAHCSALPHTSHVVQWGGAHVWKVGGQKGKVFAVCWDEGTAGLHITFKCSEMSFDLLKEQQGLRPAPYFASRGMKWIQHFNDKFMDDAVLKDYLRESYRLAALNLPKGVRLTLEL